MLAMLFKVMLTSPHDLHMLKLQHLRMDRVTTTLLMLILVIIITTSVDEVSASTEYEEMGPLPVHTFQTSSPSFVNVMVCIPPNDDTPIVTHNDTNGYQCPPAHLFVAAPSVGGHYPVLLFKHGTLLANYAYSQFLLHIASYGYIVVAPQVYMYIQCNMPQMVLKIDVCHSPNKF